MADVTVNIRGNASQLRNELGEVSNNPTNGGGSSSATTGSGITSNDRMIEDVRREMRQRGVLLVPGSSSMSQIINQVGQSQRGNVDNDISERYNSRRADMQRRMSSDYDAIDESIEERRKSGLSNLGNRANDPLYRSVLERQLEQQRELEYRKVGSKYDEEEEKIASEEKSERDSSEAELTTAIKELTEYFNRQAGQEGTASSDSFIGRLREQQKSLLLERDSSQTEEGAMDAGKRLGDVNEQLRRVLNGGNREESSAMYNPGLQASQGLMGMMSGVQSGDLGSSIMGAGGAVAGLSGMGLSASLKFLGWIGAAVSAGKLLASPASSYESLATLAAMRSTTGYQGGASAQYLGANLPNATLGGYKASSFGMNTEEFGAEAASRIKSRGMSDDWFAETMRQIGLEGSLALNKGSLQEGSKYDRYGINVTDAITRLVGMLDDVKGSGVSLSNFTRVQEKYDIQQQLMGSYMSRTDKPNYNTANTTLSAFSAVGGITQDSRVGTDIQQFQGMIQNPINDRMKALIYGTVADLFPETGGRMDLIDRAIQNPENEGKIMQSVVKRITQMYGGTDTTMGYFAAKAVVGGISPDRRDAYWKAFNSGEAGQMLQNGVTNQAAVDEWGNVKKDTFALQFAEFMTMFSKSSAAMKSGFDQVVGKLGGYTKDPTPNSSKPGGRR